MPLTDAFDTGRTYEGGGISASFERPITLDELVESSDIAVSATVSRVRPSTLNTRSGNIELTTEQRQSDDPDVVPVFEPRTLIDLAVIRVLGARPSSRIEPSDQLTIDVGGGAVRVALPVELAEHLRLYDSRAAFDVDTSSSVTTTTLGPTDVIEVSISQPTNLYWSEGDWVIVFLTVHDVVLATGDRGIPDRRSSIVITWDPAGEFNLDNGVAEPNRSSTEIVPMPLTDLRQIAGALSSMTDPAVPMG